MSNLDNSVIQATLIPASSDGMIIVSDSSSPTGYSWRDPPKIWNFYYLVNGNTDYDATTSTSVWETRELNTAHSCNVSGATLAANEVTISNSGRYKFTYNINYSNVGRAGNRIYNVTQASVVEGSEMSFQSGANGNNQSGCSTECVLTAGDVIRLEQFVASQGGSNSGGSHNNATANNIYAWLCIEERL